MQEGVVANCTAKGGRGLTSASNGAAGGSITWMANRARRPDDAWPLDRVGVTRLNTSHFRVAVDEQEVIPVLALTDYSCNWRLIGQHCYEPLACKYRVWDSQDLW